MPFLVASWRPPQAAACRYFCYIRPRTAAAACGAPRQAAAAAVAVVVAAAAVCRQGGSL